MKVSGRLGRDRLLRGFSGRAHGDPQLAFGCQVVPEAVGGLLDQTFVMQPVAGSVEVEAVGALFPQDELLAQLPEGDTGLGLDSQQDLELAHAGLLFGFLRIQTTLLFLWFLSP